MRLHDTALMLPELAAIKGMNAKKDYIEAHEDNGEFIGMLRLCLDPLLAYNISMNRLIDGVNSDIYVPHHFHDIFHVCGTLGALKSVSDETFCRVVSFLKDTPASVRYVYAGIISKTIRLGVTAKTVNKVIPGAIFEWEVQQAYPIEKYPLKDGVWFSISQKLNGVRATFYKGNLYGRSGNILTGLDHITSQISEKYEGAVLDGELTLKHNGEYSDNEAFRIATGTINSDRLQKRDIMFTVFDVLTSDEFESGKSTAGYLLRSKAMIAIADTFRYSSDIEVLQPLYQGTDQSQIDIWLERMVAEGKEGLMVNLDVPYKCKRHNGILKVKRFYTMDLPIMRCEEGTGRLAGTLGSVVVDYDGTEVGVGSGFTDEQRAWIWDHREEVIGVLAEVKYKEISYDKSTGNSSLQFPVFVSLRTDKDSVSYG